MISSATSSQNYNHQLAYILAERVLREVQVAHSWEAYMDCIKLMSGAYGHVFPDQVQTSKPLPSCFVGSLVHELQAMHCPYGLKLACLQHNEDNLRSAIKDYAQRILWQFANPNNEPVKLATA